MESATLHEILSQPEVWAKTLARAKTEQWRLPPASHAKSPVLFLGCGTSHYLAQSAAASFTRLAGNPGRAMPSSEAFLYTATALSPMESPLAVAISRSGTTTETVWAATHLRRQMQVPVIGLTCYADSDLARESTWQMVIPEAQEKSVVMTRSFTSQFLVLLLATLGTTDNGNKVRAHLERLPDRGARFLEEAIPLVQSLASDFSLEHFVFLGQGIFYGAANESMLKMKEMSLCFSEAFHTLEYRHGPMSVAGKGTLITAFLSEAGLDQELRVLGEMRKLGARTLALCTQATASIQSQSDYVLELGEQLPEEARLLLGVPVAQLLGYYRARAKGLNPDAPRHLTQVVTL